MSGAGENILCGIVVEVLKTCFVYGRKWIDNYRHADEYRQEDAEQMDEVVNKLLDIKDFYVEFWQNIPNNDRKFLGKYLKRIHRLVCEDPVGQDVASITMGDETIVASSPDRIYQQLGQYSARVNVIAVTSEDESRFVASLWERVKKEVDRLMYTVVGRDRYRKRIGMVGEWINKIDDLIAFRSNQLILRGIVGSETFSRRIQRFNLPNTSNRFGLLLTNMPTPINAKDDATLNPVVTTFNSNTITIPGGVYAPPGLASEPLNSNSTLSLGQTGSRRWAKFSPSGISSQTVIVEFKPISETNGIVSDADARSKAVREARSLIKALHIGARDPSRVHVLDCLGLVEYPHATGIIFQVPFDHDNFKCQTLNSLLLNQPTLLTRKLNNRIFLATSLAWSLSRFHNAKWVHKSFTSDNILLFQDLTMASGQQDGYSWNSPYLVGFELARVNQGFSNPLYPPPPEWKHRAYIHPERLRNNRSPQPFVRFSKRHDIYSFGVVLLEIGLACPLTAERFCDQRNPSMNYNALSPEELLQKYRRRAEELLETVGDIYAEVTLRCLNGDFGVHPAEDDAEDTLLMDQFIARVCVRLQSIQV